KRDRYFEIIDPALVAGFIHGQLLGVEPRADPAYLYPVAHRLLDIAHDDPDLPHRPEQPTHHLLPSRSKPSTPLSSAARVPSVELGEAAWQGKHQVARVGAGFEHCIAWFAKSSPIVTTSKCVGSLIRSLDPDSKAQKGGCVMRHGIIAPR